MPETWTLISAGCTNGGCQLVYRSADGMLGRHRTSARGQADRTRYFVWARPDSAPTYASAAEARARVDHPDVSIGLVG